MYHVDLLHDSLRDFAKHYTDYIPEIPVLRHVPTSSEFFSHYVIPNRPYIMSCPEGHLPAIENFKEPFHIEFKMRKEDITVNVIPNFHPYPIFRGMYMIPEVRKMNCFDFFLALGHQKHEVEDYFVLKKNNLGEFANIAADIRPDVPWATEALGSGPIAANISIGHTELQVAMNKDQYDNFFFVLQGSRRFKLIPPIAHGTIPCRKYKKYLWTRIPYQDKEVWRERELDEEIEVCFDDIEHENLRRKERHELEMSEKVYDKPKVDERDEMLRNSFFRNIKSYVVTLEPGDALYIPSMWYYEHQQSKYCICLNYHYERKWDLKFPLLRFLNKLFKVKKPSLYKDVSVDLPDELNNGLINELYDKIILKKPMISRD